MFRRFFEYTDLTECGGRVRISMRSKIARNVQQLFEDRASLHRYRPTYEYLIVSDEIIKTFHIAGMCISTRQ